MSYLQKPIKTNWWKSLSVLCLLTLPNSALAGAWLQKENGGIFINQYRHYYTEEYYDKNGDKYSDFSFYKAEYNPYVEYGLYDWLTIGGSANFQAIYNQDTANSQRTDIYLNNIELFFRTELYSTNGFIISVEPRAYVPISSALNINPDGNLIMPEIKLNLGYDLGEGDYLDASALYINRSDDGLNDMMKYELTYGYKYDDELMFLSQLFIDDSMDDITLGDYGNYDVSKIQFSGIWNKHKRVYHQLGLGYDITGKNAGAGVGLVYSVGYRF